MTTQDHETQVADPKNDTNEQKPSSNFHGFLNWYSVSIVVVLASYTLLKLFWSFYYIWIGCLIPIAFIIYQSFEGPALYNDDHFIAETIKIRNKFQKISFTKKENWLKELEILNSENLKENSEPLPLFPENFIINDTINNIIGLVIKDFVRSWFDRITDDQSFIVELRLQLGEIIRNLESRITEIEFTDLLVYKILPIITDHFNNFILANELAKNKKTVLNRSLSHTLDNDFNLLSSFNKSKKLHPSIRLKDSNQDENIKKWLSSFISKILPLIVSSNEINSPPVFILLREILSNCVLSPAVGMLSDPDYYNQIIVNKLGNVMKDRVNVKKFRSVLNQHSLDGSTISSNKRHSLLSNKSKQNSLMKYRLTIKTDPPKFEKIIKNINSCSSAGELKQYKYYLSLQASNATEELSKRNEQEDNEGDSALKTYSKRLQILKETTDKRLLSAITAPNNESDIPASATSHSDGNFGSMTVPVSLSLGITLNRVLHDNSSLTFFSEFMEKRHRTILLQFWLSVNGIRNPLEDLYIKDSDSSGDEDYSFDALGGDMSQAEDIRQIFALFFDHKSLKIDSKYYNEVSKFVNTKPNDPLLYARARRDILKLQQRTLDRMQKTDFIAFKQSDSFIQLLASEKQRRISKQEKIQPEFEFDPDEEINGDPLANYKEDNSGDENDQKVSETVLKAVEDALNEIMNDKQMVNNSNNHSGNSSKTPNPNRLSLNASSFAAFDEPTSHSNSTISIPSSNNTATAKVISDSPNTNSAPDSGTSTPRHSKLINKELHKDLFGLAETGGSGLFDHDSDDIDSDKALFDDEETDTVDEEHQNSLIDQADSVSSLLNASQELKLAAPGDLNLSDEIEKLSSDIERLEQQLIIIEPLITKAELTNNVAELKILNKSKIGLKRELQLKELQKQQYIVQESDNSLYGKSKVGIQSYINGNEDSKDFILYIIEVQKISSEEPKTVTAGWMVARRFSQFFKLNMYLRSKYPQVHDLDFPKRKVVLKFQQSSLVVERQKKLELYLQNLIKIKEVCGDRLFRDFLSSEVFSMELNESLQSVKVSTRKNAVNVATRLYNNISNQILSSSSPSFLALSKPPTPLSQQKDQEPSLEMQKELSSLDDDSSTQLTSKPVSFVKPISDLLTSLFQLKNSNAWLRGRAIILVLQQLLGGTIEKMVRVNIDGKLRQTSTVSMILISLQDSLWPNGEFRKGGGDVRSIVDKSQTKQQASVILEMFVVDTCSKVFGSGNSIFAATNMFQIFQNPTLNKHLVLTLLQEILEDLFPEISDK